MKRFILLCAIVTGTLISIACEARVQIATGSKMDELVSKMTYVQDQRTKICYSVISTGHIVEPADSALSYTYVPCEMVPPYLLKK